MPGEPGKEGGTERSVTDQHSCLSGQAGVASQRGGDGLNPPYLIHQNSMA